MFSKLYVRQEVWLRVGGVKHPFECSFPEVQAALYIHTDKRLSLEMGTGIATIGGKEIQIYY